jgi:hypothetical protein
MDDKIEAILAHTDAMVCDGCVGDYKGRAEKIGLVQDQKCTGRFEPRLPARMADDLADCRVTSFGGRERITRANGAIPIVHPERFELMLPAKVADDLAGWPVTGHRTEEKNPPQNAEDSLVTPTTRSWNTVVGFLTDWEGLRMLAA